MRPVNTILVVADKKSCLIFGIRARGEWEEPLYVKISLLPEADT